MTNNQQFLWKANSAEFPVAIIRDKFINAHEKKIGKNIYGQTMKSFQMLQNIKNPQSIITVANSRAQKQIRNYLDTLELKSVKDYIFVC